MAVDIALVGGITLTSLVWMFLLGIVFLFYRTWNIPITVLRFTGDKRRPMIIHKKGRKRLLGGVPHLWVKGYKTPIRDYKAEFYYPSPQTKWGGLVLWEFEDGWLTPVIPKAVRKDKAKMRGVQEALDRLRTESVVDFHYDEAMHRDLMFKIVDDVDAEFFVTELARQKDQYAGGFMNWLKANSGIVLTALLLIVILIGWIVWLKEDPGNAARACVEQVARPFLEKMVEQAVPPG